MENLELENLKKKLGRTSFVKDIYAEQSYIQNDERFGEISLWSKKEGEDLVFSKKISLDDEDECLEAIKFTKERKELNFDYILKLIDYNVEVRAKNDIEFVAFYEAPFKDLKHEIISRKESKR